MLQKGNNEKINQKICWFINIFNDFCNRHNHNKYIIDIDKYPYDPFEIPIEYTGYARKLKNQTKVVKY